jgi:hypothetical protein
MTSTQAAWVPRPRTAEIVLYLDLDGVVQDENVRWDRRRGVYMATPNRTLFEWVPHLEQLLAPFHRWRWYSQARGASGRAIARR